MDPWRSGKIQVDVKVQLEENLFGWILQEVWLFGDFNGWNKYEFPFERLQYGKWEIKLKPDDKGACRVPHLSKLKLAIKTPSGEVVDR